MPNEQKKSLNEILANAKRNPLIYFPEVHISRISVDQDDASITHVYFSSWGFPGNALIRSYNLPESLRNGSQKVFSIMCMVDMIQDKFYQEGFGDNKGYNKRVFQAKNLRILFIDPIQSDSDNIF